MQPHRARRGEDDVGRAIRVLRNEIGINRKELAERSGVSYPYLSEVEAGKKSPSSKTVRAIADALGVRVHRLLEIAEGLSEEGTSPGTWVVQRQRRHFHEDPYPGQLVASAPAPAAPPPASAAAPLGAADLDPPSPRSDRLIEDLTRVARGLSKKDLKLLLEMARRMAG